MNRSRDIGKKSLRLFMVLQLALGLCGGELAAASDAQSAQNFIEGNQVQSSIKGELSAPLGNDQSVLQFLTSNKKTIGVSDPANQLTLKQKTVDPAGRTHYLYQLQEGGIPVYGKYIRVHLNKSKRVTEIRNQLAASPVPAIPKTLTPKLSSQDAITALRRHLEETLGFEIQSKNVIDGKQLTNPPASTLMIYPFHGRSYLAYETELSYLEPAAGDWIAYVDANNGEIIDKYDRMAENAAPALITGVGQNDTERRLNVVLDDLNDADSENDIYMLEDRARDMYKNDTKTGEIVTFDAGDWGPPVTVPGKDVSFIDEDEVNAHFYSGVVYEYFQKKFNRNSIDGNGMDILSLVHYTEDANDDGTPDVYDNAFWNGAMMIYGDGSCYSCSLDVIGHEMVHGITQYSSDLEYRHQSGALNESFSDIFGSLIEMNFEQTPNNWTIGEDTGSIFRDMADPRRFNQPATMNDFKYVNREIDEGGVHINSGIPNHAAYLTATGIDTIGLNGKDILGQLSYDVLTNRLMPNSNFEDARDAFVSAAEDYASEHSGTQGIVQKVKDAWTAVGLPYGSRHEITSLQANGVASVWIEANSNEIYVNASSPETFNPTITVTSGATLTAVDSDYSDQTGLYKVNSGGTSVEWNVYVYDSAPYLTYKWANWVHPEWNFYEVNVDIGQIASEVEIELHNDTFQGVDGEDFLQTGKAIVSPVPEGLVPHSMLVGQKLKLWFLGEAVHHTNRDDVRDFSIRFMDSAFHNSYEYQVANYYKNDMVIDMKSALRMTDITETTASFEWPSLSDATQFQLFQSTDEEVTWSPSATSAALDGSSTNATITGLSPDRLYKFKLVTTGGKDAGDSIALATYTLSAGKHAPTLKEEIADRTAIAGGADIVVPLSGTFEDQDINDTFVYETYSGDTRLATVSQMGDPLVIHPIAAGRVEILVNAHDGWGHYVQDRFYVTISPPPNQAPKVFKSVAGQIAYVGSDLNVPLADAFKDPDGDALTITVESDASDKAIVNVVDKEVRIHPVSVGTAIVTLIADDGHGHTTTALFAVTVKPPNQASAVSNPIANQNAASIGQEIIIPLSGVFTDPDGDPLRFSASSNSRQVASVKVVGNTLRVKTMAIGTAAIRVTANDGNRHTVSDTFLVTQSTAQTNPPSGGGGGGGVPPIIPPTLPKEDVPGLFIDDEGVHLSPNENNIKTVLSQDGTKNMTITVESLDLEKAFNAMDDADSGSKTIILKANKSADKTSVELPAGTLVKASQKHNDAIISIQTEHTSFDLPLKALNFGDLAWKTGESIDKVTLRISLSAPSKAEEQMIRNHGASQGLTFISIVDFKVFAEAGGKSVEITDFGSTYVPRSIVVSETDGNKRLLAVIIDPKTGEAQFIPATLKVENGKTTIVISAPHASLYGVVEARKVTFTDIQNHTAKSEIETLASALMIKGTSATTFSPDKSITRAEFAALLTRALGLDATISVSKFTDVKDTHWFAPSVNAAVKAGIINGKSSTLFDPNATITREEMAVMVSRGISFAGKKINLTELIAKQTAPFADGNRISGWAKTAILQNIDAGIYLANKSEDFKPKAKVTRAEVAVILKKMLDYLHFIDK
ncbi:hypothetical protein Back11_43900 [Paenibacillus baekrokdamisoli]|uniref:Uncharacterized protein n=1 Tax=Paenibacillus baekrokdamisoli TaxID=1712516 RepID=A0A3G9J3W8_9BACL|nr:M4 family metallopeptidase [Paenibacillus baekrokdamisoli]MBB3067908.1 Zn-dependent metalloprotease [Paenibacillus baekrokdamisoli]BBH23045.1 hypothetical protein Back11_43900 [Paenibacillus baekrokdamisoli]